MRDGAARLYVPCLNRNRTKATSVKRSAQANYPIPIFIKCQKVSSNVFQLQIHIQITMRIKSSMKNENRL